MATSGLSWSSEFGPSPCGHARRGDEGVGRPEHEPEEERGDDVEDEGGPADDRVARLRAGSATRRCVVTTERMRPHSRMEPASADHIPVTEYRSGVTVLLFSATKDEREVVGDERVLHGASVAKQRADAG